MTSNMVSSEMNHRVYLASKEEQHVTLRALLADLDRPARKAALTRLTKETSELYTPLLIAARLGHMKCVNVLLTKFNKDDGLDVDQGGEVLFGHHLMKGATPLWAAAAAGHLDVVAAIIKAGADVNKPTATQSTPLRAACFEGHLGVVQLLLSSGADLTLANTYNNTCLMIAAFKGHLGVVKCLLDYDQKAINAQARCGATALHYAAESDHLEVARLLLDRGASLTLRNDNGLTALLSAAERCRGRMVSMICNCYEQDRLRCIEALELAGASYANDKELYDPVSAYSMLKMAMEERHRDGCEVLAKEPRQWPQYDNHKECETVEEIEELKFQIDELHLEGLCIRERILGRQNKDLPLLIVYRGAVLADDGCFRRCQMLWRHAIRLKRDMGGDLCEDLMRFVDLFISMHLRNEVVKASDVLFVVQEVVDELERQVTLNRFKNDSESDCDGDDIIAELMLIFLYLLSESTKLHVTDDEESKMILGNLVSRMAYVSPRTRVTGATLLHLAVDTSTSAPADQALSTDLLLFPNARVVGFLLEYGVDVNALDRERQSALHRIAGYDRVITDFQTMFAIVNRLVEHGIHTELTDKRGKVAIELAKCDVARVLIKSQLPVLSLKCLVTKTIIKEKIGYAQIIPQELETFIERHK